MTLPGWLSLESKPPVQPDTPPSLVLMKRELFGLSAAQGVEPTAARAQEIAGLRYDIQRCEAKRLKYGT